MQISFVAEDVFGNRETSEIFGIQVIDDDPPEILSDLTPRSVDAGDELEFCVEVSDNIMVESVHVVFGLENGTDAEIELADSGYFKAVIDVPEEGGNLFYRIRAADGAGNLIETSERSVNIEKPKSESETNTFSPILIILVAIAVLSALIFLIFIFSRRGYRKGGEE